MCYNYRRIGNIIALFVKLVFFNNNRNFLPSNGWLPNKLVLRILAPKEHPQVVTANAGWVHIIRLDSGLSASYLVRGSEGTTNDKLRIVRVKIAADLDARLTKMQITQILA